MPIINADVKGLEIVCAAYLSQDKVMMQEIIDRVDIHSANQLAFNLPEGKEGRLIAKVLKFRILYGGSEYSFARDPDFESVSTSEKYWKRVIEKYYDKYKGLAQWHQRLIQEVTTTGSIRTPTGRQFVFEGTKNYKGELSWPITQIKNFPVQSFGADVMSIARVSFAKRFKQQEIGGLIISSVHDSLVSDVKEKEVARTVKLLHEVFDDLPTNFEKLFGVKFTLPMTVEGGVGKNMKDLVDIGRET